MQTAQTNKVSGTYRTLLLSRDLEPHEIPIARAYVRGQGDAGTLPITSEHTVNNLSPIVGRNVLARRLSGDTTYTGAINYGAFGSNTAAFNNNSTQLGTEVYRKLETDASYSDNIAYIDWYIASGDVANQTFQEFGAFIDGTGTANTGQAFSLTQTGGWVKSGAMFVSLSVTIS
jgi:hypothetical protein